jgi:hypothetical protein
VRGYSQIGYLSRLFRQGADDDRISCTALGNKGRSHHLIRSPPRCLCPRRVASPYFGPDQTSAPRCCPCTAPLSQHHGDADIATGRSGRTATDRTRFRRFATQRLALEARALLMGAPWGHDHTVESNSFGHDGSWTRDRRGPVSRILSVRVDGQSDSRGTRTGPGRQSGRERRPGAGHSRAPEARADRANLELIDSDASAWLELARAVARSTLPASPAPSAA